MAQVIHPRPSTGLPGLDYVLQGLRLGDNIVWQIESIDDYYELVKPYCEYTLQKGIKLVYFRFARHRMLVSEDCGAEICQIQPNEGFEKFIGDIHQTIERAGEGAYYVFDCFSELAHDWYSDRMLGNFFMLTCPYLHKLDTIAYFSLLKHYHSFHASTRISQTAQVLIDVYRHGNEIYVHPLKVEGRYSPTLYMLHRWDKTAFLPITESAQISEVLTSSPWPGLRSASYRIGVWDRMFMHAEELWNGWKAGDIPRQRLDEIFDKVLQVAISEDPRILEMLKKYLTLGDVIYMWKRMIGTGFIGGKSVGMILSRAILKKTDPRWETLLEAHDSFFIGSEVFYTFLVLNDCWWVRQKQRDPRTFLEGAEEVRQKMMKGSFPEYIVGRFSDMLDYFGQSPIIVRSSSLLEDSFGNSFAGKYESVFCPNQGPREKRLNDFLEAIRTIYASCMSEEALSYRAKRGLLGRDEQMALLVQRVSGAPYGQLFYPQLAGVGLSFNPFVWNREIDPNAGMIRLVFGLGTRAVNRSDDDYTRLVALNAPQRRPDRDFNGVSQYTQRKVEVLNLEDNRMETAEFDRIVQRSPGVPIKLFASLNEGILRLAKERGVKDVFPWTLTFDGLLSETSFVGDMRQMLEILQKAYDYPVEVEFTANFFEDGSYKINLVQCRPFQVKGGGAIPELPRNLKPENQIYKAVGTVIGQSVASQVDRMIYVVPSAYGKLTERDRYSIARLIGRVLHQEDQPQPPCIMLLGPGRWGTTTPSLGVPVSFAEINNISVLCEIVAMRDDLIPDVSLGTHFFSELVEMDILYIAIFPHQRDNYLNQAFLDSAPNKLPQILPDAEKWAHVVRVIDAADLGGRRINLHANNLNQQAICYLEREEG